MIDMIIFNLFVLVKGVNIIFWMYNSEGDLFVSLLSDNNWLRLVNVKDLQLGELMVDVEDNNYFDDENVDWKSIIQGQKFVGDIFVMLVWKSGEDVQKKFI